MSALLDAVAELVQCRDVWEGTASELLTVLASLTDDIPGNAAHLSRDINGIEQEFSVMNIRCGAYEGLPKARDQAIQTSECMTAGIHAPPDTDHQKGLGFSRGGWDEHFDLGGRVVRSLRMDM